LRVLEKIRKQIITSLHAHRVDDWARGLEFALKMAGPIAKINFNNAAKGPGNKVILLY